MKRSSPSGSEKRKKKKKQDSACHLGNRAAHAAMIQCEEPEEAVSLSKPTVRGEQSCPTEAVSSEQQHGPGPSCVSMKSHQSMGVPISFPIQRPAETQMPQLTVGSPVSSCVSMRSGWSMEPPLYFKGENPSVRERVQQQRSEVHSCQSDQQHQTDLDSVFMLLEENMITFVKNELKRLQRILSPAYQERSQTGREEEAGLAFEDEEQKRSTREAFVKITLHFLRGMNQKELAGCLQRRTNAPICQHKLKSNLRKKFQHLFEGISKAGNPTPLNQIYTELYITEGGTADLSDEHEVRQIEIASSRRATETTITCKDIFQPMPGRYEPVRTVLTKGVAGIGKTVLTQKFTLDWAEDKANQDIHFTFPFTFRELNVLKEEKFSLVELVHLFFTETKEAGICSFEDFQVVFIFDGLDECRLPLDFRNNKILTDVTESTSVDVLLTNLISGKLLPSAGLWITTRPAVANKIPPGFVYMVTEVRGFSNPQKEEYFRKRFRDEEQASRIISHVNSSQSLHIMCHIPVFCWITATVLDNALKTREGGELPKTLTEMYIHFLVVQAKVKKVKYDGGAETDPHWSPESRKMIESLGKLAFDQLQKGNLIFYESDLTECGIDIRAASVYSGVFTQIFKEERGLYQDKVFCFIHLSVQEFLAALHVHLTFINSGINLLEEEQADEQTSRPVNNKYELKLFYQNAVEKAIQNPSGYLDMFLRFLLGLSLQSNQILLQGLLKETGTSSQTNEEAAQYIRENIGENLSAERSINLFHCLSELNDHSLVEKIQQSLSSGSLFTVKLSPAQWSALVFILMSSEKDLDVFDLRMYSASEEGLLWLLPVVKASSKSVMIGCNLSKTSCKALSSVLSKSSSLRELDLGCNSLQDSGVKQMFADLDKDCKLEALRLSGCELSWRSCKSLSRFLGSQYSSLRELDLNNNDLKDLGVEHLFAHLKSQCLTLKILRLNGCNLSSESSDALVIVLSSQSFSMIELDLSNNDLHDLGVKRLSGGLKSPHCKLETLSLSGCLITEEGCASLVSALSSNPSHLKNLDLSYNHPGPSGLELFSATLQDPHWKLDSLRLDNGGAQRLKPGLRKYACELTMDPNTVHRNLYLSENNMVIDDEEEWPYPNHAERFQYWYQVMCTEGLTGRCYWEVDWSGLVCIGVTYSGITRSGSGSDSRIGGNNNSWSLDCSAVSYSAWHNNTVRIIHSPSPSSDMKRVGVYLDWSAGTVSFYRVVFDTVTHIHTFRCSFSEPLYPVFRIRSEFTCGVYNSVSLCQMDED